MHMAAWNKKPKYSRHEVDCLEKRFNLSCFWLLDIVSNWWLYDGESIVWFITACHIQLIPLVRLLPLLREIISPIICEQKQHRGWGIICNYNQHMNVFIAVIPVMLANHTAEILFQVWSSDKRHHDLGIYVPSSCAQTCSMSLFLCQWNWPVSSDWFMSSFHLLVENGSHSEADKWTGA